MLPLKISLVHLFQNENGKDKLHLSVTYGSSFHLVDPWKGLEQPQGPWTTLENHTSSFLYTLPRWSHPSPWFQCLFLCYVCKTPRSLPLALTLLLSSRFICPTVISTYIAPKWSKPACKTEPAPQNCSSSCLTYLTNCRYSSQIPWFSPSFLPLSSSFTSN